MRKTKLNNRSVLTLPPGKHPDHVGHGLALVVGKSGGRSWVQRIQIHGRRRDIGLGSLRVVSISAARDHAADNKRRVLKGEEPISYSQSRTEESILTGEPLASKAPKTRAVAEQLADKRVVAGDWTRAYADKWIRMLDRHVGQALLTTPVDAVGLRHVQAVCERIMGTGALRTMHDVRRGLSWVFAHAMAHEWRDTDPARVQVLDLPRETTAKSTPMQSVDWRIAPITLAKVAAQAALEATRGSSVALCLLAIALTGCRTAEARGARWEEFDLDAGVWTVPAGRMKTKKEHRKPVTRALRAVLDRARAQHPGTEFVFPSRTRDAMFAEAAMSKLSAELDLQCTPHGWRATVRTWAGESGYPREEAETQIAHAIGDKVEQAYSRGDLLERRRPMMEAWGDYALPAAVALV